MAAAGWRLGGKTTKGSSVSIFAIALVATACCGALLAGSATAAPCPNEALRVGPSALLPECRAYEMVSPPNKGDGFVLRTFSDQSAPAGNDVAFISTSAFGATETSPVYSLYLSKRDAGAGWSTESVDPLSSISRGILEIASSGLSEDLGKTLQASYVALTPGAIEGGSNVYVRDNRTGARTLIESAAGTELYENFAGSLSHPYLGGSPNWSHLVLDSSAPLAEGVAPGIPQIYDYTDGHIEVVSRLENGEVSTTGAYRASAEGSVSRDGSRVYFLLGASFGGLLYLREGDQRTFPVSVSQKEGPEEGEVKAAAFSGASADGSVAYFTTAAELTDASHTHGTPSLYRYEVGSKEVTDLTPSLESAPEGAQVTETFGVSEDGTYVYFAARGALAPGASVASAAGTNLYVWHNGTIKLIAQADPAPGEADGPGHQAMVSPNGEHFAFVSSAPLTATDVPSPSCPVAGQVAEHCAQVYEYEYATGQLTCVSCNGPARGDSKLGLLAEEPYIGNHLGRTVLDNGSVFVDTPNKLVSRDSNGIEDVYMWREGTTSLISTGTSGQPSLFADSTPDGSNVYLRTDQRLVGADIDSGTDLYDARVNGGLAGQNPPGSAAPCEGEACRGASPLAAPSPLGGASAHNAATCARLSRRAHHVALTAKRADRRAKSTSGDHAARLRRVASRRHAEARRAHSEASRCRRAGR
jgi:hypothetical protein